MITLDEIKEVIPPICREFNVNQLDIFGSIASGSAKISSDLDFLVELKDPNQSPAKHFFGLLHSLEDTLRYKVDLVTVNGLKNPYFRHRVLEERVPIYER